MERVLKNVFLHGVKTDITIRDGVISSLTPTNAAGEDYSGCFAYPGLVDIHIHGGLGLDVTYDPSAIQDLSLYLARHGITTWYPTVVCEDVAVMRKATAQKTDFDGAVVAGFHIEGPYLASSGAMKSDFARCPDIEEYRTFQNVKLITVAPELDGAMDFIRQCDAVVSIGHTACDYETARKAIRCGAKCLTHTFNVMPPLHHREPGPIGAAITARIYAQVICDGVHVHPSVVQMLYRTFGADRMILISDAMAPMGTANDAVYEMNGKRMVVKDGVARTEDGRLYGSASNLFDCVQKAISFGIPVSDAFKMASETPAKLMGLSKGIAVGAPADLVIVDGETRFVASIIGDNLYK